MRIALFICFCWLLLSCGSEDRRQARIPEIPEPGDTSRNRATLVALTRAINQSSPASAYAKRAALYLSMGKVQEALEDIDEAISRNGNVGSYYLVRAQVLRALQQPGKAFESAQRAEILGVDTPAMYTLLGDLLQQQNQFERAQLYITKALQMAPYEGEAYYFAGLMAAKQGDTTLALKQYQQSLKLKPRYLETYNQLASVYRVKGDLNTALRYNEQGLVYFPENPQLHYRRGLIFHNMGGLDSALVSYQRAAALQPNMFQAYFQAGLVYHYLRNYPLALTNFQRVQQLKPQYPRVDYFIGHSLEQTGQLDAALASYNIAIRLNNLDQEAQVGIWRVQRRKSGRLYDSYMLDRSVVTESDQQPSAPVLDTARVRISTIQPKTRLSTGGDSLRTLKTIGPNK
ncbi:hypothetical protein GCM10023189_12020 [Nibrella saemangeumensis]|uniref:Tetratricopeptide repeat protein n=1 Tax=Nibrella saemangeumensis TaxID=1084526 RepID=A0ABP8MHK4_9BACT